MLNMILALDNQQWFMCRKTKSTQLKDMENQGCCGENIFL